MGTRILLLLLLTWIMRLQADFVHRVLDVGISGRDLILIGGGLFLLAKSTLEIHDSLEGAEGEGHAAKHAGFVSIIVQIGLIDIVFSLDSVITAVGLADDLGVMIIAIMIAVGVMMFAAGAIGRFVDDHPTDQDAGVELPGADRRGADRRGHRRAHSEGLHLLRDGVLGRRRDAEHPHPRRPQAACT